MRLDREKTRDYNRKYSREHRGEINARCRRYYNEHREEILSYKRRYYLEHKEEQGSQNLRYQRQRLLTLKLDALTHYGINGCACVKCGESRLACLSIDHINGGGTQQGLGGATLYFWLIKNNYPEGYQTLCMNCQFVKRIENDESRKKQVCG